MNKRIIKIVDIVFWCYILLSGFREFTINIDFSEISSIDFSKLQFIDFNNILILFGLILGMFFLIFIYIIFTMLKNFYIVALYIGIRLAYKRFYKDKLNEDDIKNESYYREIINKYSVATLSYIDDFNVSNKDIIATILSLKLKKKISIDNDIKVINEDINGLEDNEKYILDCLKDNKEIIFSKFKELVMIDCLNKKLIINNNDYLLLRKRRIKRYIISYILVIITETIIFTQFNNINNLWLSLVIFILAVFLLLAIPFMPIIGIIYLNASDVFNTLNPFYRTKLGVKINKKIEGLKNYIKDFSNLENKKAKEIELWDEYLIYSVMFDINNKVVEELESKVNIVNKVNVTIEVQK